MVSATAEARNPLVAPSQSDKCRVIEIEGKSRFWSRGIFVDQATVDANDFQRALFEVVRFLCIQSQDLPCNLAFRDDQGRDGFSSKAAHVFETMPTVGGPEASAGRDDSDDRVEETPCLMKHVGQPLVVSVGEV